MLRTPGQFSSKFPFVAAAATYKASYSTEIPSYNPDSLPPRGRPSYSSYDEPFSEGSGPPADPLSPQVPEIERGNKLLCFQNPTSSVHVLDYAGRPTSVSLSAQLHGMFFLAKSSRSSSETASVSTAELTCYRRNLFQITGSVTLPHMMQYVVTDQGDRVPIVSQELSVSAVESVEGSPVKIISVPFKPSTAGAAPAPEDKSEKEPTPFALDQIPNGEVDGDYSILPFEWKRLQFRVATANNGRRKELQQHFTIRLNIMAILSTGIKVSICQVLSGPIIVRGRSPRNFQAKEDVPLADSRPPGRKSAPSPAVSRHSPAAGDLPPQSVKSEGYQMGHAASHSTATSSGYFEWPNTSTGSNMSLHPSASPSTQRSYSVSPYAQHLPELTKAPRPSLKRKWTHPVSSMPMKLDIPKETSTTESRSAPPERPAKMHCSRSSLSMHNPPYYPSHSSATVPQGVYNGVSSYSAPPLAGGVPFKPSTGLDSTDLLYNLYGGVNFDPWMHPSDSMYQSHVLHARYLPPATSVGGADVGVRNTRYMSEDYTR